MIQVLIAGIFLIIGAAIGALAMFYVQMVLRKEKFKEIIYKDLLSTYEELASNCRNLYIAYLDVLKQPQGLDQLAKLHAKAVQLGDILGGSVVVASDAVYAHVGKMISNALDPIERDPSVGDDPLKAFELVRNQNVGFEYAVVLNKMREELGIELISQDIIKTVEFAIWVKRDAKKTY